MIRFLDTLDLKVGTRFMCLPHADIDGYAHNVLYTLMDIRDNTNPYIMKSNPHEVLDDHFEFTHESSTPNKMATCWIPRNCVMSIIENKTFLMYDLLDDEEKFYYNLAKDV